MHRREGATQSLRLWPKNFFRAPRLARSKPPGQARFAEIALYGACLVRDGR
jgi:hypothetical protein